MSIIGDAKEVAKLVQDLGNVEVHRKVVDLQGEIVELLGENVELKKQMQELKAQLEAEAGLSFVKPVYYAEDDHKQAEPLCARCWEADRVQMHLLDLDSYTNERRYKCPHCNKVYVSVL